MIAFVATVGALLGLDLLARFVGVEIALFGDLTFGGSMTVGRFGGLVWSGITVGHTFGLAGIDLSMT